jgi:hypothetical protein
MSNNVTLPPPVLPGSQRRVAYSVRIRADLLAEMRRLAQEDNRKLSNWLELQLMHIVEQNKAAKPVAK